MDRTIAETMELVGHRLQEARGEQPITRTEIVRAVVDDCGCSTSSVLPSDHCYNRTNDGVKPHHVPMFLHIGDQSSGLYQFVGRDYFYTGTVDHFPASSY